MLFCILLSIHLFCYRISITAAEDFDVQEFIAQQRKNAEANISPQLHACTNLKDIEILLYQEERDALNVYFTACNVPKIDQVAFHDAFEKGMKVLNSYHIKMASYLLGKNAIYDKENISLNLLQTTKDVIVQYGLNPNRINIIYDDNHFKKNPTTNAYAISSGTLSAPLLKIFIDDTGTIAFNVNSKMLNLHTIAHEVTHIKEKHSVKQGAIEKFAAQFKKDDSPEIQRALHEWKKIIEKQADLFPLLRLDNDDMTKQLMQKKLADYFYKYLAIDPIRIQQVSSEVHIHPTFSEIFPYIIKIQILKNNGALSLYKKNTYQYSWYRYIGIGVVAMGLFFYWQSVLNTQNIPSKE